MREITMGELRRKLMRDEGEAAPMILAVLMIAVPIGGLIVMMFMECRR